MKRSIAAVVKCAEKGVRGSLTLGALGCFALGCLGALWALMREAGGGEVSPLLEKFAFLLLLLGTVVALLFVPIAIVVFVSCVLVGALSDADSALIAIERSLSWLFISPGGGGGNASGLSVGFAAPGPLGLVVFGSLGGLAMSIPRIQTRRIEAGRSVLWSVVGVFVVVVATSIIAADSLLDPFGIASVPFRINPYEYLLGDALKGSVALFAQPLLMYFGCIPWLLLVWLLLFGGRRICVKAHSSETPDESYSPNSNTITSESCSASMMSDDSSTTERRRLGLSRGR